jgi:hypothetical protein
MSDTVVKEIISRAATDDSFRTLLFTDSATALKGYDLTDDERAMLANLNADNFDEFAGDLGGRTTQGRWVPGA